MPRAALRAALRAAPGGSQVGAETKDTSLRGDGFWNLRRSSLGLSGMMPHVMMAAIDKRREAWKEMADIVLFRSL